MPRVLGILLISASAALAAVSWNAPVTIGSDSDISTSGAGVWAFCYNGTTPVVINGVSFTSEGAGAITWASTTVPSANTTPNYAGASSLSSAYKQLLYGARYNYPAAPVTLTLNNLVVGHQYQVQVWANDSRSGMGERYNTVDGSVSQDLNSSPTNAAGGTGKVIAGTFVAASATQAFAVNGNVVSQVNAIQLRDLSVLATPAFTPLPGSYQGAQTVTLTAEAGSTIYYTVDGSAPNSSSPHGDPGSGSAVVPLSPPSNATLKAYATGSNKIDSAVANAAYVITVPPTATPTFSVASGTMLGSQTVTLSSEPGSTIYYTTDGSMPDQDSAHGSMGSGSAQVTVTAPSKRLISAIARKDSRPDSALATGFYRALSHPEAATVFTGPKREGPAKDGVIKNRWGIEQTMLYEDGVYKSWYHGAPDTNGDYWYSGAIRYATSPDGLTWTDQGMCLGNSPYHRGCPFVYRLKTATTAGEPAGYYLPVGRNGQFGFDLFYSPTGLPGSWTWSNNSNLILPMGPAGSWDSFRTGNISIWYENDQWQVLYEACAGSGAWQIGRAYGPSLTTLTKHAGNPVLRFPAPGTCIGGPEVIKLGGIYYCIAHETDPSINSTPTSCALYRSTDLNNWTRLGWLSREWVYKNNQAQVADATLINRDGKTWMWYEDVQYQNPQLPELSLMTWDMPFEELVNRPEYWDDPVAEGWAYEPGFGEILSSPGTWPSTYCRKIGNPIPPNCLMLKTDATHGLRLRKPAGMAAKTYSFSARVEQTTVKFTPLRLDRDAANAVLAGVFFDSDGEIKYYSGAGIATAMNYAANTTYTFTYEVGATGYTLAINGKRIAADIPFASPAAPPAFLKVEQEPGGVGYAGSAQQATATAWTGAVNGSWDTSTGNWSAGASNSYAEGDSVRFDDNAAGTGPVSVNIAAASVSPGEIVVSNATRDYLLGGNPIIGGGSLAKSGAALLELGGDASYGGPTKVLGGTLRISGSLGEDSATTVGGAATFELAEAGRLNFKPQQNGVVNTLNGTGNALLNGKFSLDLTEADTTSGNAWLLVDAAALHESYGPGFGIAGFTESSAGSGVWRRASAAGTWTFDEASGKLTLAAGYTSWVDEHFSSPEDAAATNADADPDGDGVMNGIEFLTGSNPESPTSNALPTLALNPSKELVIAFKRAKAAAAYPVSVEHSIDMEHWLSIPIPVGTTTGPPVTVADDGTSSADDIIVVIPADGSSRQFARVKILVN